MLSSKNGYKSSDIHVVVLKLNYALTICCLSFIDGRSMNDNKLIFMAKFIIGFYICQIVHYLKIRHPQYFGGRILNKSPISC